MKNMLSFGDLKKIVSHTTGLCLPTARQLRGAGSPIVAQKKFDDGSCLTAYQNGFAVFQTTRRSTVLRIDACGDYTYYSCTGPLRLSAEYFADKHWALRLQLEAEERIVHNKDTYEGDAVKGLRILYAAFQKQNQVEPDFVEELVTQEVAKEALSKLSDKQRKVFLLHYYLGITQTEIAEKLGVSCSAVNQSLATAKKKIKNILKVP